MRRRSASPKRPRVEPPLPPRVAATFPATAGWRARRLHRDFDRLRPDCPPELRELLQRCWELAATTRRFDISPDGVVSLHPDAADLKELVARMHGVQQTAQRAYAAGVDGDAIESARFLAWSLARELLEAIGHQRVLDACHGQRAEQPAVAKTTVVVLRARSARASRS